MPHDAGALARQAGGALMGRSRLPGDALAAGRRPELERRGGRRRRGLSQSKVLRAALPDAGVHGAFGRGGCGLGFSLERYFRTVLRDTTATVWPAAFATNPGVFR